MQTTNLAARSCAVLMCLICLGSSIIAQTGGPYDLSHTVIADGGSRSAAGSTSLEGTVAQPIAGTVSTGGGYDLRGGFWAYQTPIPTAAAVSVSGRVMVDKDRGIYRVTVLIQSLETGLIKTVLTNQFGYYRFEEVPMGMYFIRVKSRRYQMDNPELLVNLIDDLTNADFIGTPIQ